MQDQSNLVAITTIRYGQNPTDAVKVRADVFLDTATQLREYDIRCVAVAEDCSDAYLRKAREKGILIVPQKESGMAASRKEAIQAGIEQFPSAKYYLWLEPEKPDLPRCARVLSRRMEKEKAVLGLFNRTAKSMATYPPEQAHFYLFCRVIASNLTGIDIDYAFGPMILTRESLPYFVEYEGEYGDKWDATLIPRLRVINAGLKVSICPITFHNDRRMTQIEAGDTNFALKRLAQFNNVVPALITEWQKLTST